MPSWLAELLAVPETTRRARGYRHTAREINEQPETWLETKKLALPRLASGTGDPVYLTGSGSSHYIGLSLAPVLARRLRRPVHAVPAGDFLTHGESLVPVNGPGWLVSFARSGDSPESTGAVDWFLERRPDYRHVALTCNPKGALATRYGEPEGMTPVVLPPRTNDQSLVMTSSFTNLWLAGHLLATEASSAGIDVDVDVDRLAAEARRLIDDFSWDDVPSFEAAIFLGTGPRFGAAREAALKMLEMCDGRVPAFAESFLGFRHGPMCAAREGVLLVAFLSAGGSARAYENDLLEELAAKGVGADVLPVDLDAAVGDDALSLLHVVLGQLLGLGRCLELGLSPDAPSAENVITRVVKPFEIH